MKYHLINRMEYGSSFKLTRVDHLCIWYYCKNDQIQRIPISSLQFQIFTHTHPSSVDQVVEQRKERQIFGIAHPTKPTWQSNLICLCLYISLWSNKLIFGSKFCNLIMLHNLSYKLSLSKVLSTKMGAKLVFGKM